MRRGSPGGGIVATARRLITKRTPGVHLVEAGPKSDRPGS